MLESTSQLQPQSTEPHEYRVITVRWGTVRPKGSWLYVWVEIADGELASVGATGFDPELRAHLHLMGYNPDHGRVRVSVPHYQKRDFDVLAFRLPEAVKRPEVKSALIAHLGTPNDGSIAEGEAGEFPDVIGPIIEALENYRSQLQQPPR